METAVIEPPVQQKQKTEMTPGQNEPLYTVEYSPGWNEGQIPDRMDKILENEDRCWVWLRPMLIGSLLLALCVSVLVRNPAYPDNQSILHWLNQNGLFPDNLYSFIDSAFTSAAFFEVSKAVGIGSILIGWLYGVLQKEDGGFHYSELLELLYPKYNQLVIIHIFALIVCIWQASIGSREGAAISLLIILTDSFPLWTSLCCLVFFPAFRKRLIHIKWNKEINDAFRSRSKAQTKADPLAAEAPISPKETAKYDSEKATVTEGIIPRFISKLSTLHKRLIDIKWIKKVSDVFCSQLKVQTRASHTAVKTSAAPEGTVKRDAGKETVAEGIILRMISSLSKTSADNKNLLGCLARALCYYCDTETPDSADTHRVLLIRLTGCWDHLFREKSTGERNYILRELFSCIRVELDDEPFRDNENIVTKIDRALGQSYVLWLYQDLLERLSSQDNSQWIQMIEKMHNDLTTTIQSYLFSTEKNKVSYIGVSYLLLKDIVGDKEKSIASSSILDVIPNDTFCNESDFFSWDAFTQIAFPYHEEREKRTVFALDQIKAKYQADKESGEQ